MNVLAYYTKNIHIETKMAKVKDSGSSVVTSSTTASRKTRFAGLRRKKKRQMVSESDGYG